jgi:L-fuconolactonase
MSENSSLIVDCHQHFWQVGRFNYPWMSPDLGVLYQDYLPEALSPLLPRHGVMQTVVVQASNSLEETRWLLELAEHHPFIAGVVGWIDLKGEAERELDELAAHPRFKGVRHLVESEPDDEWLAQAEVIRGLRALGARGISYDLLVHPRHLPAAISVVAQCPEVNFAVDHLAKPPIARGEITEWAQEFRKIARFDNVWCKLSGLVTEADWKGWSPRDLKPFVDVALECFGPRRLMFGSDWPVCLLAADYDCLVEAMQSLLAELNEADRRMILAENAARFYRLA